MVVRELNTPASTICSPGLKSSARITIAKAPPVKNMRHEKTRYIVPMSL